MIYHISWLESAIEELRKSDKIDVVNGDLTVEEFLFIYLGKDLSKVVRQAALREPTMLLILLVLKLLYYLSPS